MPFMPDKANLMPIDSGIMKRAAEEAALSHNAKTGNAYYRGYNDAYHVEMYLFSELDCQCERCLVAYDEGQADGLAERSAGK